MIQMQASIRQQTGQEPPVQDGLLSFEVFFDIQSVFFFSLFIHLYTKEILTKEPRAICCLLDD